MLRVAEDMAESETAWHARRDPALPWVRACRKEPRHRAERT